LVIDNINVTNKQTMKDPETMEDYHEKFGQWLSQLNNNNK